MCHRVPQPWVPRNPGGPLHPPSRPAPSRPTAPLRPRLQPTYDGEEPDGYFQGGADG